MFKKTITTCILLLLLLNFSCTSLQNYSTDIHTSTNPLKLHMEGNHWFKNIHSNELQEIVRIDQSDSHSKYFTQSNEIDVVQMVYDRKTDILEILET